MEVREKISQLIKIGRIKKKMSTQDLADKLKVSRITIYRWENGKISISVENLIKIAGVLDLDITTLKEKRENNNEH